MVGIRVRTRTFNTNPTPSPPDIVVSGNGVSIADGDATPGSADHTSFVGVTQNGPTSSRTYTVTNTGSAELITSGLTVPSGFTITEALSSPITAGNSATFTVRLDSASAGTKTGEISFATNVSGKNPFNFSISGEVVAEGGVTFEQVAIAKSGTSGAHWLSPIGIPGRRNVPTSRVRRTKLVARYPNNGGGTLYPIQSEQFNHHYDTDALQHCTGHFKLPVGYVAGDQIGIGYSDTHSFPSAPDWSTLTAGGDSGFKVELSIYEPRVHWICFDRNPITGDTIQVRITDDAGTHTYTHLITGNNRDQGNGQWQFEQIMKKINEGGLYRTFGGEVVPPTPVGTYSLGTRSSDQFLPMYDNSLVGNDLGTVLGQHATAPWSYVPRISLTNPGNVGFDRWSPTGFYIWPAWRSGEPYAYTVEVQITRAVGSSLSAYSNMTAFNTGTLTTNGTITPISGPDNRVLWRATFDAATATPDSPWFDGHQVRQIERRTALKKVSDNSSHPHLEAVFRVSWDRDGAIIDRQVTVENSKIYAQIRDYWYDAEVFVGGASQTTGQAKYRHLYHSIYQYWRWASSKPIGFCRAADFMAARLILPWTIRDTLDRTAFMSPKLRGHAIDWETNGKYTGGDYTQGYVKTTLNDPLYAGAWDFGSLGGARAEIGMFNSYEWAWWTSDMIATWPSMEAMVDNVAGAHGFMARDTEAAGEDAYAPLNMYVKWHSDYRGTSRNDALTYGHSYVSVGRPTDEYDNLDGLSKVVTQKYGLIRRLIPAFTHSPSLGLYSAWIARPEKYLRDAQESWATVLFQANTQANATVSVPKTGGAVLDSNHRLTWSIWGGNRGVAWPARELARASFMRFEGARRRTYWRRVSEEIGWIWNRLTEKNVFGEFNVQIGRTGYMTSNDFSFFTDLTGSEAIDTQTKGYNDYYYPPPTPTPHGAGQNTGNHGPDAFKSNYMMMTFCHAIDLGVVTKTAEVQANIDRCTWVVDVLEYVPNKTTDWTWFLGGGALSPSQTMWYYQGLTRAANGYQWEEIVGEYKTWSTAQRANCAGVIALLATQTNEQKLQLNHYPSVADMNANNKMWANPGYSIPRQHHSAMLLQERHHSNSAKKAQATYWRNQVLTTWIPTAAWSTANGFGSTKAGLFGDENLQQMDSIRETDIPL